MDPAVWRILIVSCTRFPDEIDLRHAFFVCKSGFRVGLTMLSNLSTLRGGVLGSTLTGVRGGELEASVP